VDKKRHCPIQTSLRDPQTTMSGSSSVSAAVKVLKESDQATLIQDQVSLVNLILSYNEYLLTDAGLQKVASRRFSTQVQHCCRQGCEILVGLLDHES
jgi:hypothetical protein